MFTKFYIHSPDRLRFGTDPKGKWEPPKWHSALWKRPSENSVNPLATDNGFSSDFGHMLSIRFEDRFCASRKRGTGGGGWVHRSVWQCMVAVAAAYRKALVNDGLNILSKRCKVNGWLQSEREIIFCVYCGQNLGPFGPQYCISTTKPPATL